MRHHSISIRVAIIINNNNNKLKIPSVGKDVEKPTPSCITNRNVQCCHYFDNNLAVSQKN